MEAMDLEEQLINEIHILNKLRHPNILQLKGCFEDQKNVYLVMELATEGSLFKKMKADGLPEPQAVSVDQHHS